MTQTPQLPSADLLERMELHLAATDLMHRYQALVDAKDVDGLAEIVTDDVEMIRVQGSSRGREGFLDVYRAFAASDVDVAQHMVTNIRVSPVGEGRHRIDSCFWVITTHEAGGARQVWGRYRDDMVRVGSDWRYAAKRITVVRVALVPEESMMPRDASSFGPLPD